MTVKEIRAAFDKLVWAFDHHHNNYAKELLEMCEREEKGHRGWGADFGSYHPKAASARDCARAFAVKRVADYLLGDKFPTGKDFMHIQRSCFLAAGMVDEFKANIEIVWKDVDLYRLAAIDYCQLVGKPTAPVT